MKKRRWNKLAARDEKVMIRLSSDVKKEFQALANEYGMTMSAMAAFVIGQFVRTQRRVVEPMVQQVLDATKQAIGQAVDAAAKDVSA